MMGWQQPAPTLIVNDKTGEWVLTANITRVKKNLSGSTVYVRADVATGSDMDTNCKIDSPLSPSELRNRLFEQE